MASQIPNPNPTPLYPKIDDYNPRSNPTSSSSSSLYPTIDMKDLVENLFPDSYDVNPTGNQEFQPSAPPESIEECLITIPGAILHLIDKNYSVELATGDLRILGLRQGDSNVAVLAAVSDDIQWPLTKDLASVKLDSSHYFFSFQPPSNGNDCLDSSSSDEDVKKGKKSKKKEKGNEKVKEENEMLNYGLTILGSGQDKELLNKLDWIFENYSNFSVQKVEEKVVLAGDAVREVTVGELKKDNKKKEVVEGQCAAYWTTLAPNVEEYSGTAAKLIAAGSGQLVKGVLWCGDVTMDRLKWGNDVMMKRMSPSEKDKKIDPSTLRRIKRVKRVTKMTEKVATGVLTGVVKVSGYFTGSVANSKVGKKFFNLLPGEIVLASLDGFSKICDAVEVAGKNVMSTSSTVTTGLVSHKYGEEAAKATNEGMSAAGHAIGTAWAVFKIRKALNPKSVLKPSTLAKSAAKSALAGKKAK